MLNINSVPYSELDDLIDLLGGHSSHTVIWPNLSDAKPGDLFTVTQKSSTKPVFEITKKETTTHTV